MEKEKNYTSLVLTKKWFDMIASGEKKEEYREIKKSYVDRFINKKMTTKESLDDCVLAIQNKLHTDTQISYLKFIRNNPPRYIIFYHAYAKDRRMIKLELKTIRIDKGRTKWGAVRGQLYFVLELGEIVDKNF